MRRLIAVPATLLLLAAAPSPPPPPAVAVQPVTVQNVSPAETFIGQVQAIQSVQQIQQDEAARDEATGQVQAAQVALQTAALNLSYCSVSAPIAGRIGRAQFTLGNLVGPTSGTLATIVETDPIRVFFSVPDSQLASMQLEPQSTAVGQTREQLIKSMTLDLKLPDGPARRQAGLARRTSLRIAVRCAVKHRPWRIFA